MNEHQPAWPKRFVRLAPLLTPAQLAALQQLVSSLKGETLDWARKPRGF